MEKINQAVTRTIARWPDQPAVIEKDRRWTYAQLGCAAGVVRERLREAGLQKGDRVVLWLKNSAQYVAAYLGILEAGGVVVAVHPEAMLLDVQKAIAHADAAGAVLSSASWEEHQPALENAGLRFALLPEHTVPLSGKPKLEFASEELAQIIYTSGTTGKPKGVMLTHDNLTSNTQAILERLRLTPEDAIVAVLPFAFAYGNSIMLTHLFAGAKIILEENLLYAHCVVETMKKEKATGFSGVASNYTFLMREASFNARSIPSLRYFTSAGGPMPQGLLAKVRAAFPATQFHVMYGQTEAAARISMLPPEDVERKAGSAGTPVADVQLKIVNGAGEECAAGEQGEILVAGKNTMNGYWRDVAGTNEVLCDGWLHTGDRGYLDEEGYLFITGRSSEMIKSGGIRIHPEEIEEALLAHEDVADAGVAGVADELLGEQIVAGVVLKTGRTLTEKQLLTFCRKSLASFKRPGIVWFLEALPRSANGKLLRAELRQKLNSLNKQDRE